MTVYLITGGAGFVGSHLADALIARGDSVIVLDNLSTGRRENFEHHLNSSSFEFVEGSILDVDLVNQLVRRADHVLHLAAAVGVFNIVQNPLESLATNIRGSEIVLEAAAGFGKPTLVTSTSEIYGKNTSDALDEEDDRILGSPIKTRWSYSEAKAIEEVLAYSYWKSKGLETRIVRLFNTVGPRQVGHYGMVVPRFVDAALSGTDITIYGDGNQTRCFGHVLDIVGGLLSVIDSQMTIGEVVNLGINSEISILDLARRVIELTNSRSTISFTSYTDAYEDGFEDMQRRVPSTQKIERLTGWKATRDLDTILRDVIADAPNRQ
jgi:UDP-glucose 4-epimerase